MADAKLEKIIDLGARILSARQDLFYLEEELALLVNGPAVDPGVDASAQASPASAAEAPSGGGRGKKEYPRKTSAELLIKMKEVNAPREVGDLALLMYGEDTGDSRHLTSAHLFTLKSKNLVTRPPEGFGSKRDWVHADWTPPPAGEGGGT